MTLDVGCKLLDLRVAERRGLGLGVETRGQENRVEASGGEGRRKGRSECRSLKGITVVSRESTHDFPCLPDGLIAQIEMETFVQLGDTCWIEEGGVHRCGGIPVHHTDVFSALVAVVDHTTCQYEA